jgi:hypothetical protein
MGSHPIQRSTGGKCFIRLKKIPSFEENSSKTRIPETEGGAAPLRGPEQRRQKFRRKARSEKDAQTL